MAINLKKIHQVCLDGDWHHIRTASFQLRNFEFTELDEYVTHPTAIPGFTFTTPGGATIAGPLTAITAIRYNTGDSPKGAPL